jgi:hypothetical protein
LVLIQNNPIFVLSLKRINMNKHLKFYNDCIETGELPKSDTTGLCGAAKAGLICTKRLHVFHPTTEDKRQSFIEGLSTGWWASGVKRFKYSLTKERERGFTPLRQTIVAFMSVIRLKDFS